MNKRNNYFEDLREDNSNDVSSELHALLTKEFESSVRKRTNSRVEFLLESDNRNFIEFLMSKIQLLGEKTDTHVNSIMYLLGENAKLHNKIEILEAVQELQSDRNAALKFTMDTAVDAFQSITGQLLDAGRDALFHYTSLKTTNKNGLTVKHIPGVHVDDFPFDKLIMVDGVRYKVRTVEYDSGYGSNKLCLAIGVE